MASARSRRRLCALLPVLLPVSERQKPASARHARAGSALDTSSVPKLPLCTSKCSGCRGVVSGAAASGGILAAARRRPPLRTISVAGARGTDRTGPGQELVAELEGVGQGPVPRRLLRVRSHSVSREKSAAKTVAMPPNPMTRPAWAIPANPIIRSVEFRLPTSRRVPRQAPARPGRQRETASAMSPPRSGVP